MTELAIAHLFSRLLPHPVINVTCSYKDYSTHTAKGMQLALTTGNKVSEAMVKCTEDASTGTILRIVEAAVWDM